MGVLVFSIWISSYQVDNTVRKICRIVDRSRIFPVSYQICLRMNQKMNGMQKISMKGKIITFPPYSFKISYPTTSSFL